MTLIYYIKDNSIRLDIFGLAREDEKKEKRKKNGKWENVTTRRRGDLLLCERRGQQTVTATSTTTTTTRSFYLTGKRSLAHIVYPIQVPSGKRDELLLFSIYTSDVLCTAIYLGPSGRSRLIVGTCFARLY